MRTRVARALRALVVVLGPVYRLLRYVGRRADMLADRIDPPAVPESPEPLLTAEQWQRIYSRGDQA